MEQRVSWSQTVALPDDRVSASLARRFVREHLGEHDLPHMVDDIQLVVTELATNSVIHAQTPFVVILEADRASITVTVRDGSPAPPRPPTTPHLGTHGRGLLLVQLLSREWGVNVADGGKSVWACFDRGDGPAD